MYRFLLFSLLYVTVTSAPQDPTSNITYVKIQPVSSEETDIDTEPPFPANHRQSKIQILPLKITGNLENNDQGDLLPHNQPESKEVVDHTDRHVRNEDTTIISESEETTESFLLTTQKQETKSTTVTPRIEIQNRRTTPLPRFIPKLSYHKKQSTIDRALTTNLVEKSEKRKFISKCRCEKIWNCPKLQITVPRCPNEYFLCCF